MTLTRYFALRYLAALGIVLGVLAGILILIETIEQLRRHANADIGLARIMLLAVLKSSEAFYEALPLSGLLASVLLFVALARSSELVAARAAGRSGLRALVGPMAAAAAFGLVAVTLLNPLAVTARRAYLAEVASLSGGGQSVGVLSGEGLWLRQATPAGQMVIRAGGASPDGAVLLTAGFMDFDPSGQPLRRIEAPRAELRNGFWILQDARVWDLGAANPDAEAQNHGTLMLTTDLTASEIRDRLGARADVSVWDLPRFIAALDRAGFSSRPFAMQFQSVLSLPAMLAAMVLLAAGFTLRIGRAGGVGVRVMTALLAGFATFYLARFAAVMGETGRLPIVLAAWSPALVAGSLALALVLHREDG